MCTILVEASGKWGIPEGFERGLSDFKISNEVIVTAGVYVMVNGRFPFQIGPNRAGTALGIVRLGGHREGEETGWQCALREAFEEATLQITAVKPPATYWYETASSDTPSVFTEEWPEDEIEPILVGRHLNRNHMTPIYLAVSRDTPVPANETKGLLLLSPSEISRVITKGMTLKQYVQAGGKAIIHEELPMNGRLEPFPHLKLLHWVLKQHPDLVK
ncbi:NUDIX hydrolase [Brevibacillus choshinensis]|uniref:NUDIX hydrolase n=1 Tax=Brevibacillus choshinensis TaxID=54911 RepID=UPI002E1F47D0|nr:NUDIX domain-containing protein [Brevibacillus choshinensis]MED4582339.1 NUDIX domain-containing protein [Brevibacillus choshinensis]MED4750407.1 NUDIX domain-containing protein [Brevibacillus choshinensis]MED4781024.1 NUDIX domain-containing protein [Brevibacillus choshinensis]